MGLSQNKLNTLLDELDKDIPYKVYESGDKIKTVVYIKGEEFEIAVKEQKGVLNEGSDFYLLLSGGRLCKDDVKLLVSKLNFANQWDFK